MKLSGRPPGPIGHIFRFWLRLRKLLPKQRCHCFGDQASRRTPGIGKIYVINLDREPGRWSAIIKELRHVLGSSGSSILDLTERYAAVDAAEFNSALPQREDVDPIYTLRDQLFVEPQPSTLPTQYKLDASIQMSKAEVAVAQSHINVWRKIVAGNDPYVLILEDDVWFHSDFARCLDLTWNELVTGSDGTGAFDVLYVSYLEVKHGAPKTNQTKNAFRPERGLWQLSGYILSREGAVKLLQILPCRGPIDLWINHHFRQLNVVRQEGHLLNNDTMVDLQIRIRYFQPLRPSVR